MNEFNLIAAYDLGIVAGMGGFFHLRPTFNDLDCSLRLDEGDVFIALESSNTTWVHVFCKHGKGWIYRLSPFVFRILSND